MRIKHLLCAVSVVMMLASCTSSQENNLPYFKDLTAMSGELPKGNNFDIRLVPDDQLSVTVTSAVPEATAIYNAPLSNPATRASVKMNNTPSLQIYIVDHQGNIELPVLGTMHVQGMTVDEVAQAIKLQVAKNVKDPFVSVQLLSFSVNVMGEVRSPRRIYVSRNRYSVLDALAEAGDLTEYGERTNLLVIREENGKKLYHRLNLNESETFASPYFYLQQNDIVYVEPNKIKVDNSKYNQYNAYKLTVVSTVVSAASVVASLVIALTVK